MKKIFLFLLVSLLAVFSFTSLSFAQEKLTILISGQSHSSLYPCSCPYNPIGGIARRSTLIKQIRDQEKNVIVLEAGGSFAGGSHDANTQTTELDKDRTKYYMQSLVEMDYDAFLVSSEELKFGDKFLDEAMSEYKLNYLSANLEGDFIPYLIKEVGSVKVAVIGITDDKVTNQTQSAYENPKESLKKVISEIEGGKKADFVIVLSYLDEKESSKVFEKIEGVAMWVGSNSPFKSASNKNVNGTLFIAPAWEVRKLTKISIDLSTFQVESVEHVELKQDIKDDPKISSATPGCFTDKNCKKKGFIGKCQDAATEKSKCKFSKIKPAKLTVIKPKVCTSCDADAAKVIEKIKGLLPDLSIKYLNAEKKSAQALMDKLGINMLPAYLLDKIEEEEIISKISQVVREVDNYYLFEPGFTGVSFFAGREKIANRLDFFFDTGSKDIAEILVVLQELEKKREDIDIHLNFLAVEDPKLGLISKGAKYEIEEFLRIACISEFYPDKIWYYLSCRFSEISSSWWDDCVVKYNMDSGRIKGCARSQEGETLLKDFIKLTQELGIVFGPTFLVNNQEVFSSKGVPSVEQLENLFKQ
ncbi:hypothetical protein ACFL2J_07730 [Candidatus Omnitrophota bacterium]